MARDIHAQSIPLPKFPMSAFDLGYSLKTCAQAGWMNCHYVEECIPSDIAHIKTDLFIRLDPMTFPIMHKVKVRQNFFFVPSRLILGDDMQEEFFSCKDLGAKLPAYIVPPSALSFNPCGPNSIYDQMECQPFINVGSTDAHIIRNPLPFLMYQKIWEDWYADEVFDSADIGLVDSMIESYQNTGLGNQLVLGTGTLVTPFIRRKVSYSKDRFTSAQPDAQRVGEVYLMNPLSVESVSGGELPVFDSSGSILRIKDGMFVAGKSDSFE